MNDNSIYQAIQDVLYCTHKIPESERDAVVTLVTAATVMYEGIARSPAVVQIIVTHNMKMASAEALSEIMAKSEQVVTE